MAIVTNKIITGKRKTAIARIRVKPGDGKIMVNGKKYEDYFKIITLIQAILQPLKLTGSTGKYNIIARITGGGISGQAMALRFAISKALNIMDPKNRKIIKPYKLLRRDPRVVERKHYGHKKARKSFQFSKR